MAGSKFFISIGGSEEWEGMRSSKADGVSASQIFVGSKDDGGSLEEVL